MMRAVIRVHIITKPQRRMDELRKIHHRMNLIMAHVCVE